MATANLSENEPFACPETGLTGRPQERQRSAATGGTRDCVILPIPRSVGCVSLPRQVEPPWLTWVTRVSTTGQSLRAQFEHLRAAGCDRIFMETASGARSVRKQLRRALQALRESDELVGHTRLARSAIT